MSSHISNVRPRPDKVLVDIANYVAKYQVKSAEAYGTAPPLPDGHARVRVRGARVPGLTKLLGPVVPGTVVRTVPRCREHRSSSTR